MQLNYDEEAEAIFTNEPRLKFLQYICPHLFHTNASLHTPGTKDNPFGYDLLNNKGGYGAIRFCALCKKIDCIHEFTDEAFEDKQDKYYVVRHIIGTCKKCKRRIYRTHYGINLSSDAAIKLLYDVLPKDLSDKYKEGNLYQEYGSYIYLEFRQELSSVYDNYGEEQARSFIKTTFGI